MESGSQEQFQAGTGGATPSPESQEWFNQRYAKREAEEKARKNEERRFIAACFAMAGMIADTESSGTFKSFAGDAFKYADALLLELARPTDAASAGEAKEGE